MGWTPFQRLLIASAVALLPGCATQRATEAQRSPADDPALVAKAEEGPIGRITPGRIAIVTARYTPDADDDFSALGKGAKAMEKAGEYAKEGAFIGAFMWLKNPLFIPLMPILTPIGAVGGALAGAAAGTVAGAWSGMRSDYLDALRRSIDRALTGASLNEALAQRLFEQGADLPHYRFAYLGPVGPTSRVEMPQYSELKQEGFDSVLEAAVTSLGFHAFSGEPPSAVFEMKLRIRVVSFGPEQASGSRNFSRRGEWRRVTAWASDDGVLLEKELDDAYAELVRRVSDELLWPLSGE